LDKIAAFAYAMRASGEGACKRYFLVFVLTIKTVSQSSYWLTDWVPMQVATAKSISPHADCPIF
ncbi:MAG: hypothetical protein ACOX8U_12130, partial [Bradymonadia bacterium]